MKITDEIKRKIGQLLIIGFHGTSSKSANFKILKEQIEEGLIGGVVLFRYNIENKKQLKELISDIKKIKTKLPLFISLDEEGGSVTRLTKEKGFFNLLSAKEVNKTLTLDKAYKHYLENSKELAELGFNLNFAPCVDLHYKDGSSVIGGLGRAYSNNKEEVVNYALKMIEAQKKYKILSCIKHFPGHGSAKGDTHKGLVDVTNDYREEELETFNSLLNKTDCLMPAHLINKNIDPKLPSSLSKKHLEKVRENFKGLIISDCLHMGAILNSFTLEEVILNGLNAGLDQFLFSNNPLAAKTDGIKFASDDKNRSVKINDWVVPDFELPLRIQEVFFELIYSNSSVLNKIISSNSCIEYAKK